MKSLFFVAATIIACQFSIVAFAASIQRNGDIGAGLILGEPTGFTIEFWQGSDRAIDTGLAFSFSSFFLVYADYLFHFPGGFASLDHNSKSGGTFLHNLSPYIGIGGELLVNTNNSRTDQRFYTNSSGSSVGLGIRIPLGAEYFISRSPISVFLELVPGIGVAPSTFGFFQGGIGARYYF